MAKKQQKPPKNLINVNLATPIEIKSKNFLKDNKFLISAIISLVAILVSIVAILISLNVHSPFNLNVYSIGTYVFPANLSDNSNQVIIFILPMEFINTGAKPGIVTDMYLIVKHENIQVKYLPQYEIDAKRLDEEFLEINQINKPFQPFSLGGEDRITKFILFTGELPGQIITLDVGNFSIEIFIKDSKENAFIKKITLPIRINDYALQEIKNNSRLVFIRSPEGYTSLPKNN
ncbi:hypothetical protein A3K72_04335 [Candidatus Woesearchaeota archaeon RBG_13_36_6]|nr:MAG: hypothetical protein A3K72_04335 [Candidatus Woesearchaeota archaeon RBG_13_36_6]